MNSPINVLFYEPYPMGLGGNFLTQKLFLERLDREQFTATVMAPMDGVSLDYFRSMEINCVVLTPPGDLGKYGGVVLRANFKTRLNTVLDLLRYNYQIAKFIRNQNINIVYANCVRAQLSVGLGAWLANVPSFLYIKGELANPVIDRLCFVNATKIVFQCAMNRDDKYPLWVRLFGRKIDILKSGLDPAVIARAENCDRSELKKELGINSANLNIAILGQLYPAKGQHFAIEALSHLVEDFPRIQLFLVGDHVIEEYRYYKTELEEMIDHYELNDNVHFTGWRGDALEIASLMDVIIHPSLAEGFPRAVLESMALGKPVVASAVGGLREAIRCGENGYLVEPGDVKALTSRMRELLSSPDLRQQLGGEAQNTVSSDYLIDDKVSRLADIWKSMVKENS